MAAFSTGLALLADEGMISELDDVKKRVSLANTEVAVQIEARAVLRESEERFRFAQRAAGVGTFDWNIETGVNTWTPELEAMYGLPAGSFPGTQKAWEDLVHPDDRVRAVQRVKESLETGAPVEQEWRVIWPDGSVHWIAGRWQVFGNAASEPLHMMGVNIDVTDRKNMEEALRQSEERFRLAIKATNDAIWDVDLKTGRVSWNDTYSVVYGRPETADSYQFWIDRIHPEDRARTVDDFHAAIGGRASSWSCEYRFRRVDGEWAYVYDRAYIGRDASGRAWRVIGALQDLTGPKQAEASLRESEERFRRVFEEGPLGLALVGEDYRFLKVNGALCRMVGYSEAELVQKTFAEITHPDDVRADVELAERLFRREIPFYRLQKRYLKKSGEIIWINLTASMIFDHDGQPLYGIAMVEDITEMKHAEEDKARLNHELAHAQRMECVGRLAGGIAHDFNNLMGTVLLNAQSALEELKGVGPAEESITAIQDAAQQAVAIGRQLMTFSQKQVLEIELLDLNSVIAQNGKMIRRLIGEDVDVIFKPGPRLLVKGDRGQLGQVILNLAVNSRDAMPNGGIFEIRTSLVEFNEGVPHFNSAAKPSPYVVLKVRDTGTGMDAEIQARAFEPFFTTKGVGKGTGLGLSVVYGIVSQMGGFITVESEPDRGTEFTIHLPLASGTPKPVSEVERGPIPGGSETILVAEDETALREKLRQVLAKAGYRVLAAANGSDAFRLCVENEGRVDLLLTDVVMPEMSGDWLAQRLINLRPQIKVLYMSGYPDFNDADTCLRSLPNVLRKPFTKEVVLRRVRAVLDDNDIAAAVT
jgi:PAS domain S-box-containing protein